jgi:ribosome-binding ATPase YchF (GTP1/OBG family)
MKDRMIDRLDLMAEIGEAKWLQEIVRHSKALDQVAKQRRLLAAYRDKLRESWRSGSVLEAGAAKRAADFVGASAKAEHQIEQMERQAQQQLDLAQQGFAQAQERRRGLEAVKRALNVTEARTTAQRLERLQPLTHPKQWRSQ